MGFIPEEQLEKIREGYDIAQFISEFLPLKKVGRNHKGLCPFHAEKTPSFTVNSEKQIFHCFGCGEGGNIFRFVMLFEGVGFVEAVQKLADRSGIRLRLERKHDASKSHHEKKQLARLNRLAAEFYFNQLHQGSSGKLPLKYLANRGIDLPTARRYLLGYAPDEGCQLVHYLDSKDSPLHLAEKVGLIRRGSDGSCYDFFRGRLIFPIRSFSGDFIGFGGRALSEIGPKRPKYLNTPESPLYHKGREVYGLFEARASLQAEQKALLVEGYMDVLSLAQRGFPYVVAPLGTALTTDQVKRISRLAQELFVIFDGDRAGQMAAWRALETVTEMQILTRMVELPKTEDPDSFIQKEGADAFRNRLLASSGLMDYFIDKIVAECPADNVGKIRAVRNITPMLARVAGEVEKTLYIQRITSKLGLSEQALQKEMSNLWQRGRNFRRDTADDVDAGRHRGIRLTPFERDLLRAILSNSSGALTLSSELALEDWQHPEMKRLWPKLSASLEKGRAVADILGEIADSDLSQELSGLILSDESEGSAELSELIRSCRERLRKQHLSARRRDLARRIREAEAKSDFLSMKQLMTEQNSLL